VGTGAVTPPACSRRSEQPDLGFSGKTHRPNLFRPVQRARSPLLAPTLALGYVAMSVVGYLLTTSASGLASLWLCNGVAAAGLLLLPRNLGVGLLAIGWAADFCGSLLIGHSPVGQSMLLATMDAGEALGAALLIRRVCGAALDITRLPRLRALVLFAILPATLVAGTVGALLFHLLFHQPLTPLWIIWAGGDLLGMTIAVPAVLLLARWPSRTGFAKAGRIARLGLVGLIALTAVACFGFSAQPNLFLLVVAVIMATFQLEAPWVALTIVLIAVVSAGCTIAGLGPIAALQPHDIGLRILFLQLFLAVVTFASLVASALLSDRERIRRSLARTLAAARTASHKADEAARSKARFLATMSHEMRTPLNGVMGYAQALAARRDLPQDAATQISHIRTAGEALACLIDDVLDFSQLDAGRVELRQRPFSLRRLADRAEAMARQLIGDKPIALVLEVGPGAGHLGDDHRLSQVLLHLVGNAVKFTARGSITIGASLTPIDAETDLCRIFVRDTGIGVPAGQADQLFAPFRQADDSTTRAFGGAGLGLAISRSLVELMGGAIGCRSSCGEGAEFWIELPLRRSALVEPQTEVAATEDAGEAIEADGWTPRVLVVDDHPVNRQVAALLLAAFGCDVSACEDGAAAVRAVEAEHFDLVFMDVHMPGMDGLAASRAIRSMPAPKSSVPIVAMTAATSDEDVALCLAAGMNGHLPKPIRQDVIAAALHDFMVKAAA
jgi:signal transduction histidine kinase/ActR/RegA family two-component response regulator